MTTATQTSTPYLTGRERILGNDELIVSKTDVHGLITYANSTFLRIAGYEEEEVLGAPHSLVRHPDMPRCVFKLLWDTIEAKQEIFALVVNRAKTGDHYWVFAHVTPSFDPSGRIVGYHSNRRAPDRKSIETIRPIYAALSAEEAKHRDVKRAMAAAGALLAKTLADAGVSYEQFIFSI